MKHWGGLLRIHSIPKGLVAQNGSVAYVTSRPFGESFKAKMKEQEVDKRQGVLLLTI